MDGWILVIYPAHILGFRLGKGSGTVEGLRRGVGGRRGDGVVKVLGEIPHEVKVAVEIYTDRERVIGDGACWVTVLAPEVAVRLIVAYSIWVGHGGEDNTCTEGFLDLGVGVSEGVVSLASFIDEHQE